MQGNPCYLTKEPWVKKNGKNMFDVTMGCFDSAKICKLVNAKGKQKQKT